MEHIKTATDKLLSTGNPSTPTRITDDSQQKLTLHRKPAASSLQITEAVRHVALLKQIKPLTEQQEFALVDKLLQLNWTPLELKLRSEAMLNRETYGTVAVQYWLMEIPDAERIPTAKKIPCMNCGKEHKDWESCPVGAASPEKVSEIIKKTMDEIKQSNQ